MLIEVDEDGTMVPVSSIVRVEKELEEFVIRGETKAEWMAITTTTDGRKYRNGFKMLLSSLKSWKPSLPAAPNTYLLLLEEDSSISSKVPLLGWILDCGSDPEPITADPWINCMISLDRHDFAVLFPDGMVIRKFREIFDSLDDFKAAYATKREAWDDVA